MFLFSFGLITGFLIRHFGAGLMVAAKRAEKEIDKNLRGENHH